MLATFFLLLFSFDLLCLSMFQAVPYLCTCSERAKQVGASDVFKIKIFSVRNPRVRGDASISSFRFSLFSIIFVLPLFALPPQFMFLCMSVCLYISVCLFI